MREVCVMISVMLCLCLCLFQVGCAEEASPKSPKRQPLGQYQTDTNIGDSGEGEPEEDIEEKMEPVSVEVVPEGFIPFSEACEDCGKVLFYEAFETHIWALDAAYEEIRCWPLADPSVMVSYDGCWYIKEGTHQNILAAATSRYDTLNRTYHIGETVSLQGEFCKYTAVVTKVENDLVFVELTDHITNSHMQPTYTLQEFVLEAETVNGSIVKEFGWSTNGAVQIPLEPGDTLARLTFQIPESEETRTVVLQ